MLNWGYIVKDGECVEKMLANGKTLRGVSYEMVEGARLVLLLFTPRATKLTPRDVEALNEVKTLKLESDKRGPVTPVFEEIDDFDLLGDCGYQEGRGVYTVKPDKSDEGYRRKTRFVACGNHVPENENSCDLFAAGVDATSLRTLRSVHGHKPWRIGTTDVRQAFVLAKWLGLPVASEPPTIAYQLGLASPGDVWYVEQAIYGLRESPALWSNFRDQQLTMARWTVEIDGVDVPMKLEQLVSDNQIWRIVSTSGKEETYGYVVVYIDDLLIHSQEEAMHGFFKWVAAKWEVDALDVLDYNHPIRFLGMEMYRTSKGVELSQEGFINEILRAHNHKGGRSQSQGPRETLLLSDEEERAIIDAEPTVIDPKSPEVKEAQRRVGELPWLVGRTRPDLQHTVSIMAARITRCPAMVNRLGERLLDYLNETRHYRLALGQEEEEEIMVRTLRAAANMSKTRLTRMELKELQGLLGCDPKDLSLEKKERLWDLKEKFDETMPSECSPAPRYPTSEEDDSVSSDPTDQSTQADYEPAFTRVLPVQFSAGSDTGPSMSGESSRKASNFGAMMFSPGPAAEFEDSVGAQLASLSPDFLSHAGDAEATKPKTVIMTKMKEKRPAGIRLPTPKDDGKARAQRKPRGNLPPAPVFDGDRRKDAKCFRKYASKVDSYVEIAKNIIDDSEIGLRLHAALEGEAADFLEDIPAKTFGVEAGWQVLLKLLQDKYDEKRMHKVGSAMKGFFKLNLGDRQYTMMETAEAMDKAARRCREANLTIPDEIMIYFFFEHAQLSTERQANLLLRTSGEYDWKKMKQAVELLYQNTPVRSGPPNNPQGHRGRTRATHEMHADTTDLWRRQPDWSASEEQWGNWLQDYDPVESLFDTDFEEIPEDIARELHSCYQTHRENRQRLAKAVQARGFYVGSASKGKGRGKGDSKGKGKTKSKKGGGRARGMSLDELKAKTTCAACGQLGHWKGDPQCRAKSANEASRAEAEGVEDDEGDWYGEYSSDQWATWESERYGYSDDRMAYTIHRTPTAPLASPTARSSAERPQEAELEHESRAVARGINRVRSKAGTEAGAVDASRVKEEIKTDNFMRVEAIKAQIKEARAPTMSPSPAPEAVKRAFEQLGVTMAVPSGSSVLELLEKKSPAVDVDTLRKAMMVHKPFRHVLLEELTGSPRTVLSNMRRQPTVETGRIYLTLDTACENTVAGTTILQEITVNLQEKHNLQPIIEPESETYCFGPGEPVTSVERWFVPAGIQGAHSVICTSSIQDKAGAKIPFLAGQDWMVFVDACIDIGRNEAMLRELGVTAPLFVDFTGHLVIAIDEITDWRPGVYAFKTGYPGRLFECTSRQVQESSAASKDQAGAESNAFDSGEFSQHFAPTHMYEPKYSAEQAQLCCVPADMWEFMFENQVYVRHHRRPRCDLFVPEVFSDGPDPRDLQDIRVTLLSNEAEPIIDSWRGVSNKVREPWVGVTYFFGKQAKNLSKIDLLRPAVKVQVTLSDGAVLHAEPNELRALPQKKVHHFDLTVANKLDYQHARHLDIPQSRQLPELRHMRRSPAPSNRKARCLDWARLVQTLVEMMQLAVDLERYTEVMRLAKHRSPSVMACIVAEMTTEREPTLMPGAAPPATTTAPGQTKKMITGGYLNDKEYCNHHPDVARRTGNAHGQFMECLSCGKMWKAVQYLVPHTGETMPIYAIHHGHRAVPGGRINKKAVEAGPGPGSFPRLQDCYALRSPHSWVTAPRTTSSRSSTSTRRSPSTKRKEEKSSAADSSGKTAGPMEDEPEPDVDLKRLPTEERERIMRLAAQRLEDKRQAAAREARELDAEAKERYQKGTAAKTSKVVFEEKEDSLSDYSDVQVISDTEK
ncbi:Retrovirus-related Pol polyprotein from transposon TNT 1-94 [Symbiodinium microadriaticum]|uniref:Retrovirus-related Pol polyprotein from transposon TNT 1-94 n=1 Tax=Symbiodinium microadriaticum TaxID=2951 RepID=A0A1Q9C8U8_SYMMI|nr:Retrovirus-related Pol polyprotein from transposon TNT 1-94 [Symbiodinium microadriaticum]